MNILIDTHALIWFLNGNEQRSTAASYVISDDSSNRFISMASVWEIAIKIKTGKLDLGFPFDNLLYKLSENAMIVIAVEFSHIQSLNTLELHHRDPFRPDDHRPIHHRRLNHHFKKIKIFHCTQLNYCGK